MGGTATVTVRGHNSRQTRRSEGWGLLTGHQRGPRPGHTRGLSHGHGHWDLLAEDLRQPDTGAGPCAQGKVLEDHEVTEAEQARVPRPVALVSNQILCTDLCTRHC